MLVLTADIPTLDSSMVPKLKSPVISADGIVSEVIELIISVLSLSFPPLVDSHRRSWLLQILGIFCCWVPSPIVQLSIQWSSTSYNSSPLEMVWTLGAMRSPHGYIMAVQAGSRGRLCLVPLCNDCLGSGSSSGTLVHR